MSNVVICTQDDLDQGVVCLTRGQSIGLAMDSAAGFISLGALIVAFVWIYRKLYVRRSIDQPMHIYLIALFSFNVIMALGRITSIKWIQDDKVFPGSYCTAQGILDQLGETGSAMVTIVIAIYTFGAVIWGARSNVWLKLLPAYLVIGCISLFLAIFIGVTVGTQTHRTQHYMAPAGFWCWIHPGSRYNAQHLVGEYVWIWSVFGVSVITYTPLVLVVRGNLHVRYQKSIILMASYPAVYFILVMPTSVVRWVGGVGNTERSLPSAAILVTECIFSLSGLANVMLFRFTRPSLLVVSEGPLRTPTLGIARFSSGNTESNVEEVELGVPEPSSIPPAS